MFHTEMRTQFPQGYQRGSDLADDYLNGVLHSMFRQPPQSDATMRSTHWGVMTSGLFYQEVCDLIRKMVQEAKGCGEIRARGELYLVEAEEHEVKKFRGKAKRTKYKERKKLTANRAIANTKKLSTKATAAANNALPNGGPERGEARGGGGSSGRRYGRSC